MDGMATYRRSEFVALGNCILSIYSNHLTEAWIINVKLAIASREDSEQYDGASFLVLEETRVAE